MENQPIKVDDRRFTAQSPDLEFNAPVAQPSANNMLMEAIRNKYDPAFIKEMMDLRDRDEAWTAAKDYSVAMSKWKANAPDIIKDRHVKFQTTKGTTEYNHASLANVTRSINESMSKFGLHASWKTEQTDKSIRVTCFITHEHGHSESTSLSAMPDETGNKNSIQAIGSTISYLERYTLLALTGLATHDMDDDAKSVEVEFINIDQQTVINERIKEIYQDGGVRFLKWLKVESVESIPADWYKKAIKGLDDAQAALEKVKKQRREPGQEG